MLILIQMFDQFVYYLALVKLVVGLRILLAFNTISFILFLKEIIESHAMLEPLTTFVPY